MHGMRTWSRRAVVPAALVAWVLVSVEDWGRDFTAYTAEIGQNAPSVALRPLVSARPAAHLAEAARWAAVRVGGYSFAGLTVEGDVTRVALVRTTRPFGLHDDVTIEIRDLGGRRVLTGRSVSRLHIGDLGRNPRNLRRLLSEIDVVLDNSARDPAPFSPDGA
jgi:hypothetical protein